MGGALATAATVVVEAPASCASVASFSAALARQSQLRTADHGDRIEVRATPHADGSADGAITVVRSGLRSEERRLEGASCAEIVEGLALVAALAWDEVAPPPPPPAAPAGPLRFEAPVAPDAVPQPPPAGRWSLAVGPSAASAIRKTDTAAVAWGGFVDIAHTGTGLSPALRIGMSHVEATSTYFSTVEKLAWTYGRVSACPVAAALGSFSVRPCVTIDAGVLYSAVQHGWRSQIQPWVAGGVTARLAWTPVRHLFVEADPSLAVSSRYKPLADMSQVQYQTPRALPGLEIDLGYRFF